MKILFPFFCFVVLSKAYSFLPDSDYLHIGKKIWHNECNGTIHGLCSWNEGEEFASMGIGHFIWYPSEKGIYKEQFPLLLEFFKKNNVLIPHWLEENKTCPWKTRDEFHDNVNSQKMNELRTLLSETIHLQTLFIINQTESLLKNSTLEESILKKIDRMKQSSKGVFALIDYLNFKGLGSSAVEQYNNEGWGLLQVLEDMSFHEIDFLEEFISSAKKILLRRVKNSPKDRNEERWVKGWFYRLDSYR